MNAADSGFGPAELWFRRCMLLCSVAFGVTGLVFLAVGGVLPGWLDTLGTGRSLMARYPVPPGGEGAFWRVLAVSMMAMLTWSSWILFRDPRGNRSWVHLILLSKFVSSSLYFAFFLKTGQFPHLVGWLTDGFLFAAILGLWIPASPGKEVFTPREKRILRAVGEACVPRGGAFRDGYADHAEACMEQAQRLVSGQSLPTQVASRMLLRVMDFSPVLTGVSLRRLRNLDMERRIRSIERMEGHPLHWLRWPVFSTKLNVLLPFLSLKEVQSEMGFREKRASHD